MLDRKEKKVLLYLLSSCVGKKVYLVKAEKIVLDLSNEIVISLSNLDEIMLTLAKDGYIDYVPTESKSGPSYVVTFKTKGITFKKDIKKQRKHIYFLIARTVGLAFLSFVVGVVLRTAFT